MLKLMNYMKNRVGLISCSILFIALIILLCHIFMLITIYELYIYSYIIQKKRSKYPPLKKLQSSTLQFFFHYK